MTTTTKKFKVGETYTTRSICDHNCIFSIKVLKRTPKTLTVIVDDREEKKLRVKIWNDSEQVKPHGNYSMCPVISVK